MASYTFSKAEDDSSVYIGQVESNGAGRNPDDLHGLPLDFDPESERGPADTDQRHRLVLSGSHRRTGRNSGRGHRHRGVRPAVHAAGRRRPERRRSPVCRSRANQCSRSGNECGAEQRASRK